MSEVTAKLRYSATSGAHLTQSHVPAAEGFPADLAVVVPANRGRSVDPERDIGPRFGYREAVEAIGVVPRAGAGLPPWATRWKPALLRRLQVRNARSLDHLCRKYDTCSASMSPSGTAGSSRPRRLCGREQPARAGPFAAKNTIARPGFADGRNSHSIRMPSPNSTGHHSVQCARSPTLVLVSRHSTARPRPARCRSAPDPPRPSHAPAPGRRAHCGTRSLLGPEWREIVVPAQDRSQRARHEPRDQVGPVLVEVGVVARCEQCSGARDPQVLIQQLVNTVSRSAAPRAPPQASRTARGRDRCEGRNRSPSNSRRSTEVHSTAVTPRVRRSPTKPSSRSR